MDDPAEDIMGATFRALCDRGYAELTMRDIAEESDRSKAALHYHYDDKEGLMLAFLDHLYERFHERVGGYGVDAEAMDGAGAGESPEADESPDADESAAAIDDPDEQLRAFVAAVLTPPHADDRREFRTALLEIKAQAPYQPAFRERIARFDALVTETVTDLVEAGQAAGIYREAVDPQHVAQFVLVTLDGAGARHVIADEPVECAVASLADYFDGHLLVEGAGRERGDHAAACSMEPGSRRASSDGPTEAGGE